MRCKSAVEPSMSVKSKARVSVAKGYEIAERRGSEGRHTSRVIRFRGATPCTSVG